MPKIISNRKISQRYYKIILNAPKIARLAGPGQFLNLRINNNYDPLLRRPFSIHRVAGPKTEILYEVIGKGTQILSNKKAGEYLDVIGPLGNGFDYTLYAKRYTLPVLVAGGMGVAPLVFLAEKLRKSKIQNPKSKILVLLGARRKNELLCEKEFKKLGGSVKIATDDGSRGFKGKVTGLLKNILASSFKLQASSKNIKRPAACHRRMAGCRQRRHSLQPAAVIYACGPRPMLKEISRISRKYKIPAQISLEEHLACGIGACLGCAVNTKEGFRRICKDGPVFKAHEIIWQEGKQ